MTDIVRNRILVAGSLIVIFSVLFVYAQTEAQSCVTDTIMAQIGFLDTPDVNAAVPSEMKEVVDNCVKLFLVPTALSLALSSLAAAILGAVLSNRLLAGLSTNMSAHYEPDTRKIILRFDRPIIAQNPQRMVLLYRHAGGMAAVVPGRQCGGGGLMLAFTTDVKESPSRM